MLTKRRRRRSRASPPIQRATRQSQAAKQEIRDGGERGLTAAHAHARLSRRSDAAEIEASRVADQVVRSGSSAEGGTRVTVRNSASAAKTVQRSEVPATSSSGGASAAHAGVEGGAGGAAEPLPSIERSFFEPRMHADFSGVGIRRDKVAATDAAGYGARAFTEGATISFGEGEWRPGTTEGRRLIAHELAHTMQQSAVPANAIQRDEETEKAAKEKYKGEKQAAFASKYPQKTWGVRKLDEDNATKFVEALVTEQGEGKVFQGSPAKFAIVVDEINKKGKKGLMKGQWMAYPIGWKDPNIGDLSAELTALADPKAKDQRTDIIATIYAEQSHSREDEIASAKDSVTKEEAKKDTSAAGMKALQAAKDTLAAEQAIGAVLDEQRKYIYYAMLLRVGSAQFPATLDKIVTPGVFHGKKVSTEKKSTYQQNYLPAKEVVEKGSTKKAVNEDAVQKLQKLVGDKSIKPASDAGPFYFHWSGDTPTAEKKYQAVKKEETKAGKPEADAAAIAEKKGAFKQAKDVVKATMTGIKEEDGWLKKIPGQNKGKADERFGSMYIYR